MYVSGGHYVKFAPLRIDVMMMLLCLSHYDPTVKQSTEARQLRAFSQHPIRRIRSRHRYRRGGRARVLSRPESPPDFWVHDGRSRRIQLKALLLHPVEPCRDHQLSLRHTAGPRKPGAIRTYPVIRPGNADDARPPRSSRQTSLQIPEGTLVPGRMTGYVRIAPGL